MIKPEDLERLLEGYKTTTEQMGFMISTEDPKSIKAVTDYLDSQSMEYKVFHEINVVATKLNLTEEQLMHVASLEETKAIEWVVYMQYA